MSILRIRGDRREVERVMRELGIDELSAQRHVDQLKALRERLRRERSYRVDRIVSAWGKLQ